MRRSERLAQIAQKPSYAEGDDGFLDELLGKEDDDLLGEEDDELLVDDDDENDNEDQEMDDVQY